MSDCEELREGWETATRVSNKEEHFVVRWENQLNGKINRKTLFGKIIWDGICCFVKPSALRGSKVAAGTASLCGFSGSSLIPSGKIDGAPLFAVKIIIPIIRTDTLASRQTNPTAKLRVTGGELRYRNQVRIEMLERSTIIVTHSSSIAKKLIDKFSSSGKEWYSHWPDGLIHHPPLDETELKKIIEIIENTEIPLKKR